MRTLWLLQQLGGGGERQAGVRKPYQDVVEQEKVPWPETFPAHFLQRALPHIHTVVPDQRL